MQPGGNVQYMLDGGALLHRVPWPRGSPTYKEVCDLYWTFIQRKYGRSTVVFDGYDHMSTKAMTQQRFASGKAAAPVTFTESMTITIKKNNFLSNPKNKQSFLLMLRETLQNVGFVTLTHHTNGEADLLIIKTAVESTQTNTRVLVGDDTDLLVLLCYHASRDVCDLHFTLQQRQTREVHPSATWTKSKNSWVRKFAVISFFFMPSLDVTQHHASMELARQQFSKNLRMNYTSKSRLSSSAVILLFPTLSLRVKKHWYRFPVVNQG